jgi:hypothetical protein
MQDVIIAEKEYDSYYRDIRLQKGNITHIIIEWLVACKKYDIESVKELYETFDEFSPEEQEDFFFLIYKKFAEKYPEYVSD